MVGNNLNTKKIICISVIVVALLFLFVFWVLEPKHEAKDADITETASALVDENSKQSSDVQQGIVDDQMSLKDTVSTSETVTNVESDFLTQQGQEAMVNQDNMQDTHTDIMFGISAQTKESYANNLDYTEYVFESSDTEEFCFCYAPNLYNDVTMSEEYVENDFGMNLRWIRFTGSKGSELMYTITERNDSLSIEEMSNYVHSMLYSRYILPEDIIFSAKEDAGKIIVTGWDNTSHEKAVYHLVKITDRYVMEMQVVFPNYTSEEDRLQKAYVTECYYRMCGFSGSSASPRSYAEFWEASQ